MTDTKYDFTEEQTEILQAAGDDIICALDALDEALSNAHAKVNGVIRGIFGFDSDSEFSRLTEKLNERADDNTKLRDLVDIRHNLIFSNYSDAENIATNIFDLLG